MAPSLVTLVVLLAACSSPPSTTPVANDTPAINGLRPSVAFAGIADRAERSRAVFAEASRVFLSPRCANCHPADDSPRQGDLHALHDPPVVRGPADRGVPGMQCATCHQDANVELARVPGAPDWHLAPVRMAWLGKTAAELCTQLQKESDGIVEHVGHDKLVAWGWKPGSGREPAPGSAAVLADLMQAWIDTGAECPK